MPPVGNNGLFLWRNTNLGGYSSKNDMGYDSHKILLKIYQITRAEILNYIIKAEWRKYAALNSANSGSDKGSSTIPCRTITWRNENLLWIRPQVLISMQLIWNSKFLTHCDVIYQHKADSTLAQIMTFCLALPSHYLARRWLIIKCDVWYSLESNFTRIAHELIPQHVFGD